MCGGLSGLLEPPWEENSTVLEVHAGLEPGSTDQGGLAEGSGLWEVLARITGAARRGCHQKKSGAESALQISAALLDFRARVKVPQNGDL